jgi:carbonic anhydrase/acetyltransferase-like protein (isoleucine patch superfamily)
MPNETSIPKAQRWSGWLSQVRRVAEIAVEELEPLLPRKVLAEAVAALLPQQSFNRTRTAVVRASGVRIGLHSLILGPIRLTGIDNPCALLTIGSNTIITGPLHADLAAPVRIGDWVRIGHDVSLLTVNHEIGAQWLRSGTSFFGPIEIGYGAWIASRVTVLPGVSIGAGCVVAAGAVVTRDVPENTLVAGVPARVVRTLTQTGEQRRDRSLEVGDRAPDSSHFGREKGKQAG